MVDAPGNNLVVCQEEQKKLYQEKCVISPKENTLTEKIPMNLITISTANVNLNPSMSQNSDQKTNEGTKKKQQPMEKRSTETRPSHILRYDHRGHHLPKYDDKKNGTRCKLETCDQRTHIYCAKCNVHLCIMKDRNCFENFHVLKIPEN